MADNDIIDFYKKADTDSKPEEPLKEQVETPEPVVSEAVDSMGGRLRNALNTNSANSLINSFNP